MQLPERDKNMYALIMRCMNIMLALTDCSPEELWNLTATNATFLPDVDLLDDATKYPKCDPGAVESAVLRDTRLNITTVAYYTGITPGSRACFVCDENSGYELNTTTNERICQSDATWSEGPITCGMLLLLIRFIFTFAKSNL